MKMSLQRFCDGACWMLIGTVLISSAQVSAAPVDSRSHNCTFVDVVVSGRQSFGTVGPDSATGVPSGGVAAAVSSSATVRVPARIPAPSGCDLVRFSSATVGVDGPSYGHTATQAFLQMATIFDDQQQEDFNLVSIFDFILPASGLATLEERLPRVRARAGGQILGD